MKKSLLALAGFAAIIALPTTATAFPGLTSIYIGSGVTDFGTGPNLGVATSFHCTNHSGRFASVRFLLLSFDGAVRGARTVGFGNGGTLTASTHATALFTGETV